MDTEGAGIKDKNLEANKDAPVKPDTETIGNTDPQEVMEGPLSSVMHKGGKLMETKETKEHADKKHNERW